MSERRLESPGRRDGDGILEEIRSHVSEMARDMVGMSMTIGTIQTTTNDTAAKVTFMNGHVADHESRLRFIEKQTHQELGATNYRKWMFGMIIAVLGSIVLQGIGLMVLISR